MMHGQKNIKKIKQNL